MTNHVDPTQLDRLYALPSPEPLPWYWRAWAGLVRWSQESVQGEALDPRPDITRRLTIAKQAVKAAERLSKRDEGETVEILQEVIRLLGLERQVVIRKAGARR